MHPELVGDDEELFRQCVRTQRVLSDIDIVQQGWICGWAERQRKQSCPGMGIELLDVAYHTSGIDDDRGSIGKKRVEAPVSLPGLAPAEVAGHSLVLHVADVSDPGMGKMRPETHHRWQYDLGVKVAHGPAEAPWGAIIALDVNPAIGGGYGIAQVVPGN